MYKKNIENLVSEAIEKVKNMPYIEVGISNRHIHLSKEDLAILFGETYSLTKMKDLLQPGQFAANETVTIKGKKGSLEKVRILGPIRSATQVEISLTDGFKIGVNPPISESGSLKDASDIIIENPITGVSIQRKAVIAALRHVHVSPSFAEKFNLKDKQFVSVNFEGDRAITFDKVLVRVSKDFVEEMHLDMDEANAGAIKNGDVGLIL